MLSWGFLTGTDGKKVLSSLDVKYGNKQRLTK